MRGLYHASSLAEGVMFQRLQLGSISLISTLMVWFVGIITGQKHNRVLQGLIILFLFSHLLIFIQHPGFTPSLLTPAIKNIHLGAGLTIRYFESEVGAAYALLIAISSLSYVYLFVLLFRHLPRERRQGLIILSLLGYFGGMINDSLVAERFYPFIYLSEYTFLALVLSMAYLLLRRHVDLHAAIQTLNRNLEQKVSDRTARIDELNIELQRKSDFTERIIEKVPFALVLVREDGFILRANETARNLLHSTAG